MVFNNSISPNNLLFSAFKFSAIRLLSCTPILGVWEKAVKLTWDSRHQKKIKYSPWTKSNLTGKGGVSDVKLPPITSYISFLIINVKISWNTSIHKYNTVRTAANFSANILTLSGQGPSAGDKDLQLHSLWLLSFLRKHFKCCFPHWAENAFHYFLLQSLFHRIVNLLPPLSFLFLLLSFRKTSLVSSE